MTRRASLLLAVVGTGLEVLIALTSAGSGPWWRLPIAVTFTGLGIATFAIVGLAAIRDNARHTNTITAARTTSDPFANDRPRSRTR
ncbi:MAG: hypothetical protein AAF962_18905 [Actinomycetota bacterium]